ncbi:MAG: proprotein convertase P-domain-containing protein [Methylococcaceae bacterium]
MHPGNSSAVSAKLNGATDVSQIYSSGYAFAALRSDGSVVTWGYSGSGGNSSAVSAKLNGTMDVTQIFSTNNAFAALRSDGSVVTWGYSGSGGNSSSVSAKLNGATDVTQIYSTYSAFAALRSDGSVITWGDSNDSGNSSAVSAKLNGATDVTQICSTGYAFAALRNDGSVVTWGDNVSGGNSNSVSAQLNGATDVTQIYSTAGAFAALRSDGSVVTWGDSGYGGDSSAVSAQLNGAIDVTQIYSTAYAFAALRSDGSMITWGDSGYGGSSSAVSTQLSSEVAGGANIDTDDVFSSVANTENPTHQQFVTNPSILIPDNGTVSSTLNISGMSGPITDLNISVNIDHNWDEDLDVYLITPTGQQIELFTDVGGQKDNFTNTVLDNEASTPIGMGSAPFTGSYVPEGDLASAYGINPNGVWTLKVTDDANIITGKLNSWTLDVSTAVNNHAPTGSVTISDSTPTQGQTLSASNTLADADGLGAITYLWQADGVDIGTGNTYSVTAAEVNKSISVIAGYTDDLDNPESVSSAGTSAVTPITVAVPGFTISPLTQQSTGEDGTTAGYSIQLNTAPLANRDVTINFTSSDTSEGIIDNPTLIFTSANYATPQTLTVRGVDDYLDDSNIPYQVLAAVSTIDVFYKALTISPFSLTNIDDGLDTALDLYGDEGGSKIDVLVGGNGADKLHGLNKADDLSGGLGNDSLWGGYGDDVLWGEDGDDYLEGEQENDLMVGGAGNDFLYGTGGGLDTMRGGAGNDTYYLDFDVAKDIIDDQGLPTDVDTVIMPFQLTSYTLPTGIENGTIAEGTQASNLAGNEGDNALTGNDGSNTLSGAVGRDSLFGGSGNDMLLGGTGNDTLSGGTGKDIFKFDSALAANTDKINDFVVADDTVQLENSIFTKLTKTGVLSADNFVKAAAAHDSNDYVIYNAATGAVTYDADGSGAGAGVQIALLGVSLALTPADFVII